MRWPRLVFNVFLSNDGGFAGATSFPVAETVPWTLDSTGPERLPKTIYARFGDESGDPTTYQDDIILDETAPTIQSASASIGAPGTAGASAAVAKRLVRFKIKARDLTSGVDKIQVAPTRTTAAPRLRFAPSLKVKLRVKKAVYVRVLDAAGNPSKWRKLLLRR